jgi:ribonuclease HII
MVQKPRGKRIPPPSLLYEESLWSAGILYVAGLDEAGRGAWAGPVYAAAVILPADSTIHQHLQGVRDSKQMTPSQRSRWAEQIKLHALTWAVSHSSHKEIDILGILPATRLAMQRALEKLDPPSQHLLIDYLTLPACDLPQTSLVKGDQLSLSIAAASVLAKTERDRFMVGMDRKFNGYCFAQHKGYGTSQHRLILTERGMTAIHRRCFSPMKMMLSR